MDIENIKDAVYELEGLLELAELREDKIPALLPLMKNKLDTINSLFSGIKTDSDEIQETEGMEEMTVSVGETEPTAEEVSGVMVPVAEETAPVLEDSVVEEEEEEEEESPAIYNTPDEDDEEVFVPLISHLRQDDAAPIDEVPTIPVIPDDISEEEVTEATTQTESYGDEFSSSYGAEYELADDDDEETVAVTEPTKAVAPRAVHDQNAPKPAFCINDRFRFRRELFGNSDADFSAAMDLVTTMADYEEAEDYFIAARGWNPEQPEVMDFMAIIRNYFDK